MLRDVLRGSWMSASSQQPCPTLKPKGLFSLYTLPLAQHRSCARKKPTFKYNPNSSSWAQSPPRPPMPASYLTSLHPYWPWCSSIMAVSGPEKWFHLPGGISSLFFTWLACPHHSCLSSKLPPQIGLLWPTRFVLPPPNYSIGSYFIFLMVLPSSLSFTYLFPCLRLASSTWL